MPRSEPPSKWAGAGAVRRPKKVAPPRWSLNQATDTAPFPSKNPVRPQAPKFLLDPRQDTVGNSSFGDFRAFFLKRWPPKTTCPWAPGRAPKINNSLGPQGFEALAAHWRRYWRGPGFWRPSPQCCPPAPCPSFDKFAAGPGRPKVPGGGGAPLLPQGRSSRWRRQAPGRKNPGGRLVHPRRTRDPVKPVIRKRRPESSWISPKSASARVRSQLELSAPPTAQTRQDRRSPINFPEPERLRPAPRNNRPHVRAGPRPTCDGEPL